MGAQGGALSAPQRSQTSESEGRTVQLVRRDFVERAGKCRYGEVRRLLRREQHGQGNNRRSRAARDAWRAMGVRAITTRALIVMMRRRSVVRMAGRAVLLQRRAQAGADCCDALDGHSERNRQKDEPAGQASEHGFGVYRSVGRGATAPGPCLPGDRGVAGTVCRRTVRTAGASPLPVLPATSIKVLGGCLRIGRNLVRVATSSQAEVLEA